MIKQKLSNDNKCAKAENLFSPGWQQMDLILLNAKRSIAWKEEGIELSWLFPTAQISNQLSTTGLLGKLGCAMLKKRRKIKETIEYPRDSWYGTFSKYKYGDAREKMFLTVLNHGWFLWTWQTKSLSQIVMGFQKS